MSSQQAIGSNLEDETGWRMMDEDQRRGHHTSQADAQEGSEDVEEFMLSERQAFDSKVDEETGWRLLDEQESGRGGGDLREDEEPLIRDEKFDEVQLSGQEEQSQQKPETYQQQLDVVERQQKEAINQFENEQKELESQAKLPEQQLDLERWEGEGGQNQNNFRAERPDEATTQLNVAMDKTISAEVADVGQKSLEKLTLEHLHKQIDAPRGLIPKGDFTGEPQTNLEASKAQASR
ncbi:hypothetical protein AAVH_08260 [Aphelenchoides avenae]|nr:hypothetical protein AAVH_08260 [Aphelenchus avenae]